MSLNLYRILPRAAGLMSVAWLIMICTILIQGIRIPQSLHGVVITWFGVSLLLIFTYIGLVAVKGPVGYSQLSKIQIRD